MKRILKKNDCISVIVSILIVVVISIIIVVPIYVYLTGMPKKTGPITISIDCKYNNDTKTLRIIHLSGESINNAITIDAMGNSWNRMEVRGNNRL